LHHPLLICSVPVYVPLRNLRLHLSALRLVLRCPHLVHHVGIFSPHPGALNLFIGLLVGLHLRDGVGHLPSAACS
jgi:hypothetical protein